MTYYVKEVYCKIQTDILGTQYDILTKFWKIRVKNNVYIKTKTKSNTKNATRAEANE